MGNFWELKLCEYLQYRAIYFYMGIFWELSY